MRDQKRKTTPLDKTFPKIFSHGGIFPVSPCLPAAGPEALLDVPCPHKHGNSASQLGEG